MATASSLTVFPPPPTYAEPTIVDNRTGKAQFNPIWLKWFLDVASILSQLAVGANAKNIDHEQLADLLGGDGGGHYHLTRTALTNLLLNPMMNDGDMIVGGTVGGVAGTPVNLPAGTAIGQRLTIISPGVVGWV